MVASRFQCDVLKWSCSWWTCWGHPCSLCRCTCGRPSVWRQKAWHINHDAAINLNSLPIHRLLATVLLVHSRGPHVLADDKDMRLVEAAVLGIRSTRVHPIPPEASAVGLLKADSSCHNSSRPFSRASCSCRRQGHEACWNRCLSCPRIVQWYD